MQAQIKRGWLPVALTSARHEQNWDGPRLEEQVIRGIHYYRMGAVSSLLPVVGEYYLMKRLAHRITAVIRNEQPHLLHAHSPILTALPALWIGQRLGIPVIYEIRAFWEDAAVDHGTYKKNSWQYRLVRFLETWTCRKAAQVVVLCRGLKDDLIQRGIPADKLTPVPNGVTVEDFCRLTPDLEYRKSWRLEGKKVIGFIGSFYHYEGLDLLIKAVASLAITRSDIALLLIGGGEMEKELRAQVSQLGINEIVIMPGRISPERIPGIYALIDILAYPRYSMRLTELVTPLKPLEAMAAGKALIASDIGGHRELICHGQTGMLFRAGDVSALQRTLVQLLDNLALRHALSRQAADWVQQERSWDRTTAVYSEIYANALTRKTLSENGKLYSYH
jgi:PEP-CTERM/exosortase A-associated glycosyltransferase